MKVPVTRALKALAFVMILLVAATQAAADPEKLFKTRLDNGLTVIIEEEHSAPVASIQMWVRVGGADEPDRLAGISHVFEHMLFKGTASKSVGQIASMIESVGGDINAYTSFDNTVYHLTVPSRHFSTGLDVISDAIQNSSFDPEELKKELEVVLEEIRMNEDNPGRRLYKSLFSNAYAVHPYKRPVIGYTDTVNGLTRQEIVSFFRKWYVPNNMVLVIVGDVDREKTLSEVKAAFKGFKSAPDPHKKRAKEPEQAAMRTNIFSMQVQDAQFGMAFHIPSVKSDDQYAIDVLEVVLSGGQTSRLYKKLKLEDELVHAISAYSMSLKNPGLFFVNSTLKPENVEKAVSGALDVIARLEREGPNHEELQRAKFNLESSFVFSRETMNGLASKLGYYEVILGDVEYEKKYIENIRKVTADDVKEAVSRYLRPEKMTLSVLLPEAQKGLVTKESVAAAVEASRKKAKTEEKAEGREEGKTTKFTLANGMRLIVKEVHTNPTVAFYATFPGGLRFEDSQNNGIGSFTASMLTRGTVKRTREELAREAEEIAGGVSGFSGWNSTGVSGKFLSMYFDRGAAMLADVVRNPVFPESEITKLRADTLAAIKRQEDNLSQYTFKLLQRELFDVHPFGMPVAGSEESIKALTRDDLVDHHRTFFTPERMVLVVVGDIDTDYARKRIEELFNGFEPGSALLPVPPADAPENGVERTGARKDKEQTHIGIGFNGTTIGSPESYALSVMTEVLAGQGGRLFIELRDKRSLAYSVSAFSRDAADPGMIAGYIATAPGKRDEAIAGLLREFERLTTEPVSMEELKRAKMSLIGSYEIGLQEVSSQAADMANNELYGLGYGFHKLYPGKIESVSAEDVMKAAGKYLDFNGYVISVVGPNGEAKAQE